MTGPGLGQPRTTLAGGTGVARQMSISVFLTHYMYLFKWAHDDVIYVQPNKFNSVLLNCSSPELRNHIKIFVLQTQAKFGDALQVPLGFIN